jgi:hypothetical protein
MKKIFIFIFSIMFLFVVTGTSQAFKFRIYKANKYDKALKHQKKLQDYYNQNHVPGTPWIISLPVTTWEGKHALTYVTPTYPDNDGDDGVVDNIDPPVGEE